MTAEELIEELKEIDKAIEVLKDCQLCWADCIANKGEAISDYDAITQAIRCLKEYKDSEERVRSTYKQVD